MSNPTPDQIKQTIKAEVYDLGFLLSGFTTPDPPDHFTMYESWVNSGYHAEMSYLSRSSAFEKRKHPNLLFPEVKTILVLGCPYPVPHPPPSTGYPIAAYAQGPDYHHLINKQLAHFPEWLSQLMGYPVNARVFTDTAPILERELAVRAGLGWIGKNSMLIHPEYGSFFFLTEVFLDFYLPPDNPFNKDLCGTCTQCVENCPTACILPQRQINSNRCLSYLTIEKNNLFSENESALLSGGVFGCDICQSVCPWNQKRIRQDHIRTLFDRDDELKELQPADILTLNEEYFLAKYGSSPLARAKRFGILRNLLTLIGNQGSRKDLILLASFLSQEQNENLRMIASHAQARIIERLDNKTS